MTEVGCTNSLAFSPTVPGWLIAARMRTSGSGTNRIDRTRYEVATRAARGDDLPSLRSLATAIRRPASPSLSKDRPFHDHGSGSRRSQRSIPSRRSSLLGDPPRPQTQEIPDPRTNSKPEAYYAGGVWCAPTSRKRWWFVERRTWVRHQNGANEPKITPHRNCENEATIMRKASNVRDNQTSAPKSRERTQDHAARNRENEATIVRTRSNVRAEHPPDAAVPCRDVTESRDNDQAENNGIAGQGISAGRLSLEWIGDCELRMGWF